MGNLSSLTETIGSVGASLNEFISNNRTALYTGLAGVGGIALGATGGYLLGKKSSQKKRKSKARNKRKRSGRAKDRKFISKQRHERYYAKTHPKRRRTGRHYRSHKKNGRVKYTKNGQPYIILKSGKARFIKK